MSGDGYSSYGYAPYYEHSDVRHDNQLQRNEHRHGHQYPAGTAAYSEYPPDAVVGIGQERPAGLTQEPQHGYSRPNTSSSRRAQPRTPMQRPGSRQASNSMIPPARQMEGFGAVIDPVSPDLNPTSSETPLTIDPNQIFGRSEYAHHKSGAHRQTASSPNISPSLQSTSQTQHVRSDSGSREQLQAEMKTMIARMQEYKSKDPTLFSEAWEQLKRDMPARALPKKVDITASSLPAHSGEGAAADSETFMSSYKASAPSGPGKSPAQQRQQRTGSSTTGASQTVHQPPDAEQPSKRASAAPTSQGIARKIHPPVVQPTSSGEKADSNSKGKTIWPEEKRVLLARIAVKFLTANSLNHGKAITQAEIQDWLQTNPTYDELCEKLYARGFQFEKGVLARHLLSAMSDSGAPVTSPTPQVPSAPSAQSSNVGVKRKRDSLPVSKSIKKTSAALGEISAPHQDVSTATHSTAGSFDTSKLNPLQAIQYSSPYAGAYPPNTQLKTVPSVLTKEAMARKADFGELMDLTQLPDSDEDEGAERPQKTTDIAMKDNPQLQAGNAPQVSAADMPLADQSHESSLSEGQKAAVAKMKGTQLAQDLSPSKAARKSSYNPATIARDVLIARGIHPYLRPLNFHLNRLRTALRAQVPMKADLSTFRWDLVDPVDDRALQGQQAEIVQRQQTTTPKTPSRTFHQKVSVGLAPAGTTTAQQTIGGRAADRALTTPGTSQVSPAKMGAHCISPAVTKPSTITSQPFVAVEQTKPGPAPGPKSTPKGTTKSSIQDKKDSAAPAGVHPAGPVTPSRTGDKMPAPNSSGSRRGRPPQVVSASMRGRLVGPTRDSSADAATASNRRGRPPGSKNLPSSRKAGRVPKAKVKTSMINTQMPADGIGVVIHSSPPSTVPVEVSYAEERPAPPEKKTSQAKAQQTYPDTVPNNVAYQSFNCRWIGCKASLHNLDTLRKHLVKVHKDKCWDDKTKAYSCFWNDCEEFDAFVDASTWEQHIQKVHLEPLARELGDGPTTHPAAPDFSYLMDEKGRFVVPIASTDGPPDPLPLYAGRGPTRAYHKAHGNDTPEARAQAEHESLKYHAVCAAKARQGLLSFNKTAEWRTDWDGPSGMESTAVSGSEAEESEEINVIDAMVE